MSGVDPEDDDAFAPRHLPALRAAVAELCWLLGRGYAEAAAATLVGDHHQLSRRQRLAVRRCACAPAVAAARSARRVEGLAGRAVGVDGFNQLVTVERGLAGGAVLRGADGALRDVAGVHGTWRSGRRTDAALERLVAALAGAGPVVWVLDAPVSNSGRLAARLRALGQTVELRTDADRRLIALGGVLASADGPLLDRCAAWFGLAEAALAGEAPILDLAPDRRDAADDHPR